ncbi:MAG: SDR family oxidoreductase [Ignavibacteria bacterium]|nr:SDR family oxidoreductase [Ignavibacteria bacterium]
MTTYCCITGASAGIGKALAQSFAKAGYNLILIARSAEKLYKISQQIQQEYGNKVFIYAADLTDLQQLDAVCTYLRNFEEQILIFINNAGIGRYGEFSLIPWHSHESVIALNITALTRLTHSLIPKMKKFNRGHIINIASTASFIPGPYMATYYASKAYVLSYSQALNAELKEFGITVTAVCPGPVKTNFQTQAGFVHEQSTSITGISSAEQVANICLKVVHSKNIVRIIGKRNALLVFLVKLFPRRLSLMVISRFQRKRNH